MGCVGIHLHLKDHTVVLHWKNEHQPCRKCHKESAIIKGVDLDVAFFGVLHLVPAQVVAEAPVVLL